MKKLCVFTLYGEKGASSRYRVLIFQNELEKHFNTKVFRFWSNSYISKFTYNKKKYFLIIAIEYLIDFIKRIFELFFIVPKYDILFIQKQVIPGLKSPFLKHLINRNIKIVYDVDDAIYLDDYSNTDTIASLCNSVICGNETLFDHYKHLNSNCFVIPTIENTRLYRPFWKDSYASKIIGWIGSGVTLNNLDIVVDAINEIVSRHPEVKFHIICNTAGEYLNKIKNSEFIKWTLESYIEEMSKFTIGIMPLKDNGINNGKCGFKLIQCLNMKKPVIATDIGVNREIVGECGLMAQNSDEWIRAFELLLFNENKYSDCVNNISSSFFEKYDYDQVANKLIGVLDK